ncbi:potassium transporter Trk [Microbacterium invictum]|uniref:Potassium transporter Trk n=1 Tax=Microbacterium invictum TaxID=515415 RepID=A0AA40SQC4_9MICO|nr:potassium transporter Trk [Microbacterium invictum]MBB4140458.1 hypothetical protein [Microbacterium invictum]
MTEPAGDRIETARVRRSPRYGVFLAAGAAVGLLAALILTFVFDGFKSPAIGVTYSTGQVFGFLALYCIPIGLALTGILALILDRVAGKRTHEVRISRERFHTED